MTVARGLLLGMPPLLLLAVLGGLARLGILSAPANATGWHGPLMIGGFFAGVIGVERAAAGDGGWRWAAPLLCLLGAASLLLGLSTPGLIAQLAGGVVLLLATGQVALRHPARHHSWMAVAAASLVAAGVAWALGAPIYLGMPLGIGFLVLTILAERLELSRLMPRPAWAAPLFDALGLTLGLGLALGPWWPIAGARLAGAALVLLALWLLRFDVVRFTLRRPGTPRFVAWCLSLGYLWLALGGLWWALGGPLLPDAGRYDAVVHMLLLGFVFSMVFGHAPIILPAVAQVKVRVHPVLYLPVVLLHVAVGLRALGGALGELPLRQLGAGGAALALLGYALALILPSLLWRESSTSPAPAR